MDQEKKIKTVNSHLKKGGIIIFPTDTQWAMGCDAFNLNAIESIYTLKKRDKRKKLIWMVDKEDKIIPYVKINQHYFDIMNQYWPGALTIIFDKKEKKETIGVRIPNNSIALKLLKNYSGILATTSANISGEDAIMGYDKLIEMFGMKKKIMFFENDKNFKMTGKSSTIVSFSEFGERVILRQGDVKLD